MNREIVLIVITSVNLVFILFGFGESSVSYHLVSNRLLLALCVMWDRLWGEQDMRFLESRKHVEILICSKSWADKFVSLLVLDLWLPPSFNGFRILDLAASTFLRWRRLFILYVSIHDVGKHGCWFFVEMIEIAVFQNDRTKSNLLLSRNSQYTRT